jgi:hypothetical protein
MDSAVLATRWVRDRISRIAAAGRLPGVTLNADVIDAASLTHRPIP